MSQMHSDTSLYFGICSKSSEAQDDPSVTNSKSSEAPALGLELTMLAPGRAWNPSPVPVLQTGRTCLHKAAL